MADPVFVEIDKTIASVVLNRPDKLNALDLPHWVSIGELMVELHDNDAVRCVVIRGVDERAFSAGADIAGFETHRNTSEQVRNYGEIIDSSLTAVRHCRHPVVAAIRGVCVGGGLELASACDLRICGESSRFGAPINRLGLTMSHDELEPLVQLLGASPVLDLLLSGDLIDAERARSVGLVNRIWPDSAVVEQGYGLAARIAAGAPLVNRWHKKFIRRLQDGTPLTDEERDEALAAFETEDYREGRAAFLQKRDPHFRGE